MGAPRPTPALVANLDDAALDAELAFAEGFDLPDSDARRWLNDLRIEKRKRDTKRMRALRERSVAAGAVFGIRWNGLHEAIALTGHEFTIDDAYLVAGRGACAPDFRAWAEAQPFGVEFLTDDLSQMIVRADLEVDIDHGDPELEVYGAWVEP